MKQQVEALTTEAEQVVRSHCGKLTRSMIEMGYEGLERTVFLKLASGHLLGSAIDLFLEFNDGDSAAIERFVAIRIEAKKHRDTAAKKRDLH
jgi:hypothetical protein